MRLSYLVILLVTEVSHFQVALVQAASSIELQPGTQYQAGTRIQSSSDGISFVIPEEWMGGLPPNEPAFILGSNSKASVGIVLMRSKATLTDIEALLNTQQDLGDGVQLLLVGPPTKTDDRIMMNYAQGPYKGQAVGIVGKPGNAVVFFMAGPSGEVSYHQKVVQTLIASLVF